MVAHVLLEVESCIIKAYQLGSHGLLPVLFFSLESGNLDWSGAATAQTGTMPYNTGCVLRKQIQSLWAPAVYQTLSLVKEAQKLDRRLGSDVALRRFSLLDASFTNFAPKVNLSLRKLVEPMPRPAEQ